MDNATPVFDLLYTAPPGLRWGDATVPTFLSLAERERLAGLRFPRRRRTWLLGRWAAKALLQQVLPGHPDLAQIEIVNEPGGAPFARLGAERIPGCLTISHRDDTAFTAYTPDATMTIGVDLEVVESGAPEFLNDYLTPGERAAADALLPAARAQWMYLCWSAKEAVLKALRIGLSADTRAVEVLRYAPGAPGAWTSLDAHSTLPGAENLRLWWQPRGVWVLTLAALNAPDALAWRTLE